jgi:hypothetical protein
MSRTKIQAAIDTVPCAHCGAGMGEPCRNAKTGRALPLFRPRGRHSALPNICRDRRQDYARIQRGQEPERSDVGTSPVVNSIIMRSPVDKLAAVVTSPGASQWETAGLSWRSAGPPPTRSVPSDMRSYVGTVRGQLTVVGLSAIHSGEGKAKAQWLCRCSCGYYVVRTTRAVGNERNNEDACEKCRKAQWLKSRSLFRATGTWEA